MIVQVALVRPGPIQGGAVHPYLERRKRLREDPSFEIPYEHPDLEPILADTLGAIVFQDQVIQVAMALAGFTAGEAEGLRRAMSRKRSEEALNAYGERFVAGAIGRGIDRGLAERVFEQVRGFSGFGFPKSHAAAFGLLAYQSTWLRVHYGPELLCALFNEQPMGFYPPDSLTHEAQRRGIEIRPVDVNRSDVECTVEPLATRHSPLEPAVRLGLGYIKGVAEDEARDLVAERERGGRYRDLADLASRSGAGRDGLERLAWAGACEPLGVARGSAPRRDELWRLGVARGGERMRGRPTPSSRCRCPCRPRPTCARWTPGSGSSPTTRRPGSRLGEHPVEVLRPQLDRPVTLDRASSRRTPDGAAIAHRRDGRRAPAARRPPRGSCSCCSRTRAGSLNVIVPPPVYERCRLAVRTAAFALVEGTLERREGVINLLASTVERLHAPTGVDAEVRHIEPPADRELGRDAGADHAVDLAAVAPRGHSFGRRG